MKTGKIEEKVVNAYQKIEDGVVGTYKKVEDGVVDETGASNEAEVTDDAQATTEDTNTVTNEEATQNVVESSVE